MIWHGLIRESLDLFQLSYRTDVVASAGSHGRGGCVDGGQTSDEQIDVLRLFGWTAQRRNLTNPDGSPIVEHWHGHPLGCPHLSPAAQAQERDWYNRDAGLQGSGRVVGRWPIDRWDVALRRMETRMARTLDDIKAEIIAELKQSIADVPRRVWSADVIPDVWVNDPKNTTVQAGNAPKFIGNDVKAIRQALKTLSDDWKKWQASQQAKS